MRYSIQCLDWVTCFEYKSVGTILICTRSHQMNILRNKETCKYDIVINKALCLDWWWQRCNCLMTITLVIVTVATFAVVMHWMYFGFVSTLCIAMQTIWARVQNWTKFCVTNDYYYHHQVCTYNMRDIVFRFNVIKDITKRNYWETFRTIWLLG